MIIPITRSTVYSCQNAQNNTKKDFSELVPRGGVLGNRGKLRTLPRHYTELGGMVRSGRVTRPAIYNAQEKSGNPEPMWR